MPQVTSLLSARVEREEGAGAASARAPRTPRTPHARLDARALVGAAPAPTPAPATSSSAAAPRPRRIGEWSSSELFRLRLGHARFGDQWAAIHSTYGFAYAGRTPADLRAKWEQCERVSARAVAPVSASVGADPALLLSPTAVPRAKLAVLTRARNFSILSGQARPAVAADEDFNAAYDAEADEPRTPAASLSVVGKSKKKLDWDAASAASADASTEAKRARVSFSALMPAVATRVETATGEDLARSLAGELRGAVRREAGSPDTSSDSEAEADESARLAWSALRVEDVLDAVETLVAGAGRRVLDVVTWAVAEAGRDVAVREGHKGSKVPKRHKSHKALKAKKTKVQAWWSPLQVAAFRRLWAMQSSVAATHNVDEDDDDEQQPQQHQRPPNAPVWSRLFAELETATQAKDERRMGALAPALACVGFTADRTGSGVVEALAKSGDESAAARRAKSLLDSAWAVWSAMAPTSEPAREACGALVVLRAALVRRGGAFAQALRE